MRCCCLHLSRCERVPSIPARALGHVRTLRCSPAAARPATPRARPTGEDPGQGARRRAGALGTRGTTVRAILSDAITSAIGCIDSPVASSASTSSNMGLRRRSYLDFIFFDPRGGERVCIPDVPFSEVSYAYAVLCGSSGSGALRNALLPACLLSRRAAGPRHPAGARSTYGHRCAR